jgi:fibro-slime domain-containing protein
VPGVNLSRTLDLVLKQVGTSNIYSFDDRTDSVYSSRGGFFPINGELFGNSAGDNKNFHFTFELNTEFTYKKASGQVFTFTGDDDVLVYVDGKLVIDIGGIHSAVSQTIDMDRLTWLQDNKTYRLDFFFTERHRTQSNFRIDTTIALRRVEPPAISGKFD